MKFLTCLFPVEGGNAKSSLALLIGRVVFGLTFASHGLQKLQGFNAMADKFPDPLGLGSELSLILVIFGELICGSAFVLGFLTRLALLPMIFSMMVAFFVAHGGVVSEGELAFVYLFIFVTYLLTGAGKYSVDGFIAQKVKG